MSRNHKYFLPRLYYKNKLLFYIIVVCMVLHLNANFLVGGQQTPFFLWNLYAAPTEHAEGTFFFYETRYNDNKRLAFPHTWQQPEELFFLNTLNHFVYMKLNGGRDPLKGYIDNWNRLHPFPGGLLPVKYYTDEEEMARFPGWYKRKIAQYTGDEVNSVSIYKVTVMYDEAGRPRTVSKDFLFKL